MDRSEAEQIAFAKQEMAQIIPWVPLDKAHWSTLRIDRAEAGQQEKKRPDTPFVKSFGHVIVCWPTKLTLAPLMGDMVLAELQPSAADMAHDSLTADLPVFAEPPWSEVS